MSRMSTGPERDRRRRKAAAMRAGGMTIRQVASVLGVSHPTILRDLRAHEAAEAEQVLAVLAGNPQRPKKPPPRLSRQQSYEARRSKFWRWHHATGLRQRGASLRSIAREVGTSPATVLRDLRRDLDWASDQANRADIAEARERIAGRRVPRPRRR
jgi:IS30 family transposase